MKAVVYQGSGSPSILKVEEIEKPTPKENEVLIKVCAAAINPLDWKLMKGGPLLVRKLLGIGKPKMRRPGVDVAGRVEAVGRDVTQFKPGDEVFGTCQGAFAEYTTTASAFGMKSIIVLKPENVSFGQAASAPVAALTALQGLRDKGRIKAGHRVLINGASGGVGTFAVQMARMFDANVTAVCSTRNTDLVRSLGAHRVIDYTKEDFTRSEERYDLFLDCVGNHPLRACRRVLEPHGVLVMAGVPGSASMTGILGRIIAALLWSQLSSRKMMFFVARVNAADLNAIADLMARGQMRSVIDRSYRLEETPEAFRYMEEGHARGKVLILMEPSFKVDQSAEGQVR